MASCSIHTEYLPPRIWHSPALMHQSVFPLPFVHFILFEAEAMLTTSEEDTTATADCVSGWTRSEKAWPLSLRVAFCY